MTAPRDVRLLRVPTLKAAHRAVAAVGCDADPVRAAGCVVLVPSRAAADELQRTLQRCRLDAGWQPLEETCLALGIEGGVEQAQGLSLPRLATRAEWYAAMWAAVGGAPAISAVEREVLLEASSREAMADGDRPPFRLGPGLIAAMLDFYDALRRNLKRIDDFDRLLTRTLEPSADVDRGARRMLEQTRFLAASYRRFEARCEALGVLDEHGLRTRLVTGADQVGIRQLVVTLPDQAADPEGLWPADFDLMARLPGLARIDVVATEAQLATGLHERLHERLPGLVECRLDFPSGPLPVLLVPDTGPRPAHFTSRDREDELADALGRTVSRAATATTAATTQGAPTGLDRCGLVYQRPLPYLYLARQLLESADLPYETIDSLPLAAEPYVAAVDLVISFVASGYTRAATVALLSSPHLHFVTDGIEVTRRHAAALDARLTEIGYLGGRERLVAFAPALEDDECRPAHAAAATAAQELDPLLATGPPSLLLATLIDFLERHDRSPAADDPLAERHSRTRGALLDTLRSLRDAEARFGDRPTDVDTLRASIRRWVEGQTFAPRTGQGGLRLTDARAAAYGDFDAVHLLGLVEGEWPAAPARNIFFPAALLRELGWTSEADRLASARAAFSDLLYLAGRETSVSTFSLEDDAIVRPAAFLEELDAAGLVHVRATGASEDLRRTTAVAGRAASWATLRAGRSNPRDRRFHGSTGPQARARYSVTAVETYLACPFKYFAARELGLDEDVAGDGTMTPLERGRLVHQVVEAFFASWAPGMGPVTSLEGLRAARRRFQDIVEARLAGLPEGERQLERRRFLGTVAAVGICGRILMVEALAAGDVVERLLEHDLSGEYPVVVGGEQTTRLVRGKADRIDLLADGFLRIIDYKSGKAPPLDRALQLPVYAACAERQLEGRHGRQWTVGEAAYVPLAGPRAFVPVIAAPAARDAAVARAERLLTEALGAIEAGEFPPQPAEIRLCVSCAFAPVCRKDYVDVEPLGR